LKKPRILHLSTAHPANDPRLAYRVIPSLAAHYPLIALLPKATNKYAEGVRYIGLPFFRRVLVRLLISHPIALWHILWLRPSLLHVYDPELLPLARLVQLLMRIPVIYEVHENFYKKLPQKAASQGMLFTHLFRWFDTMARRHFHLIFTEHGYLDTYTRLANPSVVIYNYPSLPFLEPFRCPYAPNRMAPEFFYIGWISLERAFDTLVAALAILKGHYPHFRVHLFGGRTLSDDALAKLPGFSSIRGNLIFYGYTDQHRALPHAARATAGLALLKPVGDYPESYTTKLFEYMALGLPVVTSDFPLYRDVVERHQCGFCVSPNDPIQVANALVYLIEHPDESLEMGQRGRHAVETIHNWAGEARKLLDYYALVLNERPYALSTME
jgi:glycosyltransferase involved in cell wall biosynthesis